MTPRPHSTAVPGVTPGPRPTAVPGVTPGPRPTAVPAVTPGPRPTAAPVAARRHSAPGLAPSDHRSRDRAAVLSAPGRLAGYFVTPREAAAVAEPAVGAGVTRFAPRVAVLGVPSEAPPVAAALANALRAHHRDAAAAVAVWAPASPLTAPQSGPATPAAARLAARLTARGLASTARGWLAWLPLESHPVAAALASRRAAALEVPLVTALAGPRTEVLEGLLGEQDLVVVVTRDPDGPLARLAVTMSGVPAVACPPLAPGPRLLALAGLAGARSLAEPARDAARALQPAGRWP